MEIVSSFSIRLDKIDLVRCKEKVELECDLMKVMMRAMYAKSASKNVESKNENLRLIEEKHIDWRLVISRRVRLVWWKEV
ncbi:hypothetical protein PVL29_011860 [Vitis rotundifolia]|uniref:Uncharacterized protein n=1 Tax=Vitis rotundifolia TaxID=103349 RepID=A0AA38ZR85_VITRO|nr:hypothetical protein PVL29_011860 [Vitis rotundifolia]